MGESLKDRVSRSRVALGNPYAHLDYLEEFAAVVPRPAVDTRISASRKLLQDPYAHLDEDGEFSAILLRDRIQTVAAGNLRVPNATLISSNPRRKTNNEIEETVKDLHARLWRERDSLWSGNTPTDPVEMLDPAAALRLLGYGFSLEEGFASHHGEDGLKEAAGLINYQTKMVHISRRYSPRVQRFTAAHELGHAVLHNGMSGLHRDRAPDDWGTERRDPVELEADRFAAYFLMPEKLVRAAFLARFGTAGFQLSEETAFALFRCTLHDAQRKYGSRRKLARALASAEYFNMNRFVSLEDQFQVSTEAMAIRLEQLGLVGA